MKEKISQLKADLFKAIAHPTRIRILELLKDGELCVCDIFEELNVEQANTSQHLAILKKQDILQSRKEGLRVIYSIKYPEIIDILKTADNLLLQQAKDTMSTFNTD
ncbi:ArsR/SmtB family transcription factor [Desulforamulus aquiferis]|uniref:Metalloregulator ArsR/SmtB family transcription factor n=1 Tax=Desulforamulus aquiferis TaxID=1397668 RepID=A0AAW7ZDT0_9FIRM|nr:metalloregulator ArsR/SmtB family transcription factor [Desulforamulus aquiferis]MDO7787655.1 metalloregulator ArsR/SmtB family transcription factor [Desulforamulus aquiferis]